MGNRLVRAVVLMGVGVLVLTACGAQKVGQLSGTSGTGGAAAGRPCGTVKIAVNPWVGYEANAAVVTHVLKNELGCKVTLKNLKEEVSWQGFATGQVDAILENWGHEDLTKQYIEKQKVAVDVGPTGNEGVIGWYVPPWLAQTYPDITDWRNLNKYASMFRTSESGGKGQLLDGDPSYVTNDAALVRNLNLNYKVVYAGSETALIQAFRQAEKQKKPVIGYFYEPQWLFTEVKLVKVKLPPYKPGCDADPQKVACDYPVYVLNKLASKKFAESGNPAYEVIKNFTWTNEDQNEVARSIAVDKMPDEAAAKKWADGHPDVWKAWLPKGC